MRLCIVLVSLFLIEALLKTARIRFILIQQPQIALNRNIWHLLSCCCRNRGCYISQRNFLRIYKYRLLFTDVVFYHFGFSLFGFWFYSYYLLKYLRLHQFLLKHIKLFIILSSFRGNGRRIIILSGGGQFGFGCGDSRIRRYSRLSLWNNFRIRAHRPFLLFLLFVFLFISWFWF